MTQKAFFIIVSSGMYLMSLFWFVVEEPLKAIYMALLAGWFWSRGDK